MPAPRACRAHREPEDLDDGDEEDAGAEDDGYRVGQLAALPPTPPPITQSEPASYIRDKPGDDFRVRLAAGCITSQRRTSHPLTPSGPARSLGSTALAAALYTRSIGGGGRGKGSPLSPPHGPRPRAPGQTAREVQRHTATRRGKHGGAAAGAGRGTRPVAWKVRITAGGNVRQHGMDSMMWYTVMGMLTPCT